MPGIKENISLKSFNTFGIDISSKYYAAFTSMENLQELLNTKIGLDDHIPKMILGGGSNILFTKNFDGLVLKNETKGIEVIKEDKDHIYIKCGAGENWHRFVMHCVENNYAGIENLALIPGSVGASPMQNIGAYGVEIKETFHSLEAIHLGDLGKREFNWEECHFGYRESVFKNIYKDQFAIVSVTYRLNKFPKFNTSYGALEKELEKMKVKDLSIRNVSEAVIRIRQSKLPDPAVIGNAGSFFKNPEVEESFFIRLKAREPEIVGYPLPGGRVKLAAGWLIERCGWKGYRKGDAGCHEKQSLVLVNFGNATGQQILDLSEVIREDVIKKFGISLQKEVNII